jgi:EmrB/QacA subfamily drug resistance transporter
METTQPQPLDREILTLGGVVVAGTILAILDATIVNVAIPTLGGRFHTSISTIQWVLTAYLLALATVIPLSGWAAERFGARRTWLAALVLFVGGSLLAGSSWSIGSLIGARVVQGVGGGLLMPVGQTILTRAAGPRRIGRVMSVVGIPMLLAPIAGPVIGGAIVDQISWRWIFFVNLPVGVLAIALALRFLPDDGERRELPLDWRGLLLLPVGLALLVYGLAEVGSRGGVGERELLLGIGGLVLVALFVAHAWRRGDEALIDVTLLRRAGFAAAAATNLLIGMALFGALVLLPLYYQLVRGESPLATGLLLVPQALGAAVAMPIAGTLTDKIGARRVIPTGVVVALAGTAVYTQVGGRTSYVVLAAALFAIGIGLGATVMPSMAVAYQSVRHEAVPHATSTINVVQRIAGSVGTALLAVVLQRAIESGVGVHGGIAGLAHRAPAQRAAQAGELAGAFGTTFWVALGLVAATLVPALLLPRRRERSGAPSAAAPSGGAA